jgi:hypothetical protein
MLDKRKGRNGDKPNLHPCAAAAAATAATISPCCCHQLQLA